MPRIRHAARILIFDPADRLLLLRFDYTTGPLARTGYWGVPGGGVEEGESLAAAAVRELSEETGIQAERLEPTAAESSYPFRLSSGEEVTAADHYFLLRLPKTPELSREGLTLEERENLTGSRWWMAAELRAGAKDIVPGDLPEILARTGIIDADSG
ncbi:MAG: NUDIX domain-containing protein [Planctomycetota bacterium]|jgi:8-oxo-dGTP pyrophosphatase MutT (NUDIX family)|nr:NUDIX domain-containing protein [Planctomycetota bacterium]